MDKKLNELQVKEMLGINDFRQLSKDKVIQLASMIPEMDSEVAIKVIEQFPDFVNYAVTIINQLKEEYNSTLDANKHSLQQAYEAYGEVLDQFSEMLKNETISPEERHYFAEKMVEIADKIADKDSENKSFLHKMLQTAAVAGAAAIALSLTVLGVKFLGVGKK